MREAESRRRSNRSRGKRVWTPDKIEIKSFFKGPDGPFSKAGAVISGGLELYSNVV